MQKRNLLERLTALNGRRWIFAALLFPACKTLVTQQTTNEVFKGDHMVYDTLNKEKQFKLSLVNNYVLKISDSRDSIFLIPYKITSTEKNGYCFDFPYGNPKWDYKNMILMGKQIVNIESIKKEKKLLEYAQISNEAFYKTMLNTRDSLRIRLFEFGLFLKEGVKKIEIIDENKILFKR